VSPSVATTRSLHQASCRNASRSVATCRHGKSTPKWVDPTLHMRWDVPSSGNETDLGVDLSADPTRPAADSMSGSRRWTIRVIDANYETTHFGNVGTGSYGGTNQGNYRVRGLHLSIRSEVALLCIAVSQSPRQLPEPAANPTRFLSKLALRKDLSRRRLRAPWSKRMASTGRGC
jgi:hypothetical protein